MHPLDSEQIQSFVSDGFVKLEAAVPREVGDQARELLWRQIGLSPDDPAGWTQPVVWATDQTGEGALGQTIRSPRLAAALDQICGAGGWAPRHTVGMVPIRFPNVAPADDRGWHIDANFGRPDGTWAVSGRPETMLLLILFSDVGPDDAPTRIRAGSQRDSAGALADGVFDFMEAAGMVERASSERPVVHATGQPGDIYLVHPFTVHAAQEHLGTEPRFMSQLPVILTSPLTPEGSTPLARAAHSR